MNIEEIVQNPLMSWGGLLMGIMTLVQVAPIEISPWSWLAKKIGRAINGEVLKKLGEVERRLDKHIVDDDRILPREVRAPVIRQQQDQNPTFQ